MEYQNFEEKDWDSDFLVRDKSIIGHDINIYIQPK